MNTDYITRQEHEEFKQRIEDENERQNKRLDALDILMKEVSSLTVSVEKLALNMENMYREQVSQGKRLQTLENRDGEMLRNIIAYAVTAVIGIVIGFVATNVGFG